MKRLPVYLHVMVLAAGFAVSCEKEIEFKGEALDPKIVVYSVLDPDSIITAGISVSHPIFDPEYTYKQIVNADVKLFEDGVFLESLVYVPLDSGTLNIHPLSVYASTSHKPVPGKHYRLEVSLNGYKKAVCEASLPAPVDIISVDTSTQRGNDSERDYNVWNTRIRFRDPAGEENFYRLILRWSYGYYSGDKALPYSAYFPVFVYIQENSYVDTKDPLLVPAEENSLFGTDVPNTYLIFSDELISGKEHELVFNIPQIYQPIDTNYHEFMAITVELQSISRDLYKYLLTYAANSMLEDNFISEPVMVYSNVENGLGAFGACVPSRFSIMEGSYPQVGVYYVIVPSYYL